MLNKWRPWFWSVCCASKFCNCNHNKLLYKVDISLILKSLLGFMGIKNNKLIFSPNCWYHLFISGKFCLKTCINLREYCQICIFNTVNTHHIFTRYYHFYAHTIFTPLGSYWFQNKKLVIQSGEIVSTSVQKNLLSCSNTVPCKRDSIVSNTHWEFTAHFCKADNS